MIWTDEAVEELKAMWDRGMTTGQIAKALNVTKNSIIGKVHRLCLTARPSPIKRGTDETSKSTSTPKKPAKEKKETKKQSVAPKKEVVSEPQAVEKPKATPSVEERNIPLVKLDNHTCRWPLGDPRDEDFCFCGKRVKMGQTYCEEHAGVAYVKQTKKL